METTDSVKILLVDDRAENLFALELILSNENYFCVKAHSGQEALEILVSEPGFAIVLMDVQMPIMDGYETAEHIRKNDSLKDIPIIFLTASMDSSAHIFKGYQAGAVDYMIKPISPVILKAKVSVFVDLFTKTQELLAQKKQMRILYNDVTTQKLLSEYSLSLIEASHDPLFAINPEGKITDLNNASVKVIGLSREKLIGTDFSNYFTEPQMARAVYEAVFEKGSVADAPLTLRHTAGKLTDVLFNGSVYKDDRSNGPGVVIVARDVTAQKRFENELIEAKSNAEKATQIAEDAVKSKQQFLSNMSHEIRTPMNAIIGFTKVVLKTELNEKQQEYLNAIKVSGDALIVLINDILDLAKVDAGKMTFTNTPFKLSDSISAMLHLFETKIQEKNLEFIKEYDANIPDVIMGDPVRLHQIILNLVSNAIKFTNAGKITVSVRQISADDKRVQIEFSIIDTGIGIAQNKLRNIFDDFQQATSETSRLYGGTGLGLAIVKQLVESQGGSISVRSDLGKGSVFSFILGFNKTQAKVEIETGPEPEIENRTKKVNILVVEDILLNQLLMKTVLEEFGFDLEIAGNGKLALEALKRSKFDIILMDLQMPEMNGFEATTYIRKNLSSEIPIIALTADVTTMDVEKCKAIGMNDYISKPINEKLLYSKIIKHLKKPEQTTQKAH
jgi:PAS domain S-box-containing protein